MRKAITLLLLTLMLGLFTAGCMTLGARRYMEACLKAGYNEGECEMRALEINRRAWQDVGQSFQEMSRPPQAPRMEQPASRPTTCIHLGGGLLSCQ